MKCSICNEDIKGTPIVGADGSMHVYEGGNNAEPVNSGRCCDECNMRVVIPARLGMLLSPKRPSDKEE